MFTTLLIAGLVIGCIYGLVALGYSIIYKASGIMNLAQGDFMTLGAFLGMAFYKNAKLPFAVSMLLTVLIMFTIGFLIQKQLIRPMINKGIGAVYLLLTTIAISNIIYSTEQIAWSANIQSFPSVFNIMSIKILDTFMQPEQIMCLVVGLISMVLLHIFMTKTKMGTSMRAAAMDPTAAEACGIDVTLNTGITWGLAGGIAGIAGMLLGPIYGVSLVLGATIGRKGFSAAVIGGYGNMYGAILGGVILGLIETMAAGYISSTYKDLVAWLLLLIFLFVKPTGIFNEKAIQDD